MLKRDPWTRRSDATRSRLRSSAVSRSAMMRRFSRSRASRSWSSSRFRSRRRSWSSSVRTRSSSRFSRSALLDERDVDRRVRVVPERAEAATSQLELDEVLLDLDERDHDAVAGADRRFILDELVAVVPVVERLPRVWPDVDAVGRPRHVDAQRDAFALEERPQRDLVLGAGGLREAQETDGHGGEHVQPHSSRNESFAMLRHLSSPDRCTHRPVASGSSRRLDAGKTVLEVRGGH